MCVCVCARVCVCVLAGGGGGGGGIIQEVITVLFFSFLKFYFHFIFNAFVEHNV